MGKVFKVSSTDKNLFCTSQKCPLMMMAVVISLVILTSLLIMLVPGLHQIYLPTLPWWKKTIIYQIYPLSFQDSNADGKGDLKGIQNHSDHFVYLNVKAIWISPIYKSPMKDFGYDVTNHTDINAAFGSLEDFEDLIAEYHGKGIKVILDYIPNHTSDKHRWFQESQKSNSSDNFYRDYYIWSDGLNGTQEPPNNWLSVFGDSAWTWNKNRKQFYYHAFFKYQPDLNWRKLEVQRDMLDVLEFWLKRGVDGFRVDAIQNLFEEKDVSKNAPRSKNKDATSSQFEYLESIYVKNFEEIFEAVKNWSNLLHEYEKKDHNPRLMVVEVYGLNLTQRKEYYDAGTLPFNMLLISDINHTSGGNCFHKIISDYLSSIPDGKWPNFVTGNHDRNRVSARMGSNFVDAFNILLLLLPGTPTAYYGEEIGMDDIDVPYNETKDLFGKRFGENRYKLFYRDPERSPMQWTSDKFAGFTTGNNSWLPVHPNYTMKNVKQQKSQNSTTMKLYQKLAKLRKEPAFVYGKISYPVINKDIFSFYRHISQLASYLVTINVGDESSKNDYSKPINKASGEIVVTTVNIDEAYKSGKIVPLTEISLSPGQGLVIKID